MNILPSEDEHLLILPKGLRLSAVPIGEVVLPWANPSKVPYGEMYLCWDGFDEEHVPVQTTKACLWELSKMDAAEPQEFLKFVQKWGLLDRLGDMERQRCTPVSALRMHAQFVRSFLNLLVTTDAGEACPAEILEPLILEELLPGSWSKDRRRRHPLEFQELVSARFLPEMYSPSFGLVIWDDEGRRVYRREAGVVDIAWSHIYALFLAPKLDVYTCGVCGAPFEYQEESSSRRPRAGVRPLCSDECRREAKKESNRGSWARNKDRWRAPKKQEGN